MDGGFIKSCIAIYDFRKFAWVTFIIYSQKLKSIAQNQNNKLYMYIIYTVTPTISVLYKIRASRFLN